MKKFLVLIFTIFLSVNNFCLADGLWDNYGDQNAYGKQQFVSDEAFDKALESKKKKKRKKHDKNIQNGDRLHQSNEIQSITDTTKEPNILCIPAILKSENGLIPVGHYEVVGEKRDGKLFLKLYQAHYLIAEIPAIETNDDYNQASVNFVEILEHPNNKLKIIYGSIDFNAYSIIDIAE